MLLDEWLRLLAIVVVSAILISWAWPCSSPQQREPTQFVPASFPRSAAVGNRAVADAVQNPDDAILFYMYSDDVFQPDLCDDPAARDLPKGGYWCMGTEWALQASKHPWRVHDPSKAQLFVIPFDLCASHASRKPCHKKGHIDRVEALVAAINQSKWFLRNGGRDHMWVMPHNGLPAALIGKRKWGFGRGRGAVFLNAPRSRLIENMTIGRYLSYHLTLRDEVRVGFSAKQHDWLREEEKWGCTVVLPIVTPKSLWITETFERWEARKIFIFFRGNGGLGGGCFMKVAERARAKAIDLGRQNLSWPGLTVLTNAHAATPADYRSEIKSAKYCLVFACDDPQTSRYFEAIVAGCIPVLINDAWSVSVAPFAARVNYAAFTITIPEAIWTANPAAAAHLIYNRPRGEQRRMQRALMQAQRELLWRHNQSNVATNVLHAAHDCIAQ